MHEYVVAQLGLILFSPFQLDLICSMIGIGRIREGCIKEDDIDSMVPDSAESIVS